MTSGKAAFATRTSLRQDLDRLSLVPGDAVMVHAAVRRLGPVLGGPDTLIAALADAVGADGTILAYADWNADHDGLVGRDGRVPPVWRDHVAPFDPNVSRASRENGILPEFLRTTPHAKRSGNPGASVVALGAKADWFVADHPLDYGYGARSPFAKLVESGGKVLMLGAPPDTMTLLHHAEHLADMPGKRVARVEVPFRTSRGIEWRMIEEFDTTRPVTEALSDDHFAELLAAFLEAGKGRSGRVGEAPSLLVEARTVVAFAVDWLERSARR